MKNILRCRSAASAALAVGSFFVVAAQLSAGVAPAPAGTEQAKTHTLFMGVDISLAQEKTFYRVRDVSGGSFVIDVKGQPVFVPMQRMFGAPINMRVEILLKLSRASAVVSHLKGERAYTPGNDPRREITEQQMATQIALADKRTDVEVKWMNAQADAGKGHALFIQTKADTLGIHAAAGAPGEELLGLQQAEHNRDQANDNLTRLGGSDNFTQRLEKQLALELYDAMEVNFEVSAESPLNNPYVVVITRFHEAGAKPGQVNNWIYAKSLDPIADKPEKVHVLRGGFPPGFILEEFQVHLYNQGREVATSVAPKRVPLTPDEAMVYLMIEYLGVHKTATIAASPALANLPADFQSRLARGEGRQPVFVRVSKDGRVTGAFLDEECTRKLADPYFAPVVGEIRFKPALEKGKPVEGITRLKLSDLSSSL